MYAYHMHAEPAEARGGHQTPWPELKVVVSCQVGAGNQTWVPSKSSNSVYPFSHRAISLASGAGILTGFRLLLYWRIVAGFVVDGICDKRAELPAMDQALFE